MKGNFKRVLAIFLGVLMFLCPVSRASAQIELVKFSDGSRLIRFQKEDLNDMVSYYEDRTSKALLDKCKSNFTKADGMFCMSIFIILFGLALSIAGFANGFDPGLTICGITVDLFGMVSLAWGCILSGADSESDRAAAEVLLEKLIRENVAAGEKQPLLSNSSQKSPDWFLILERPKNKAEIDPKEFFITDCDTSFLPQFRTEKFKFLISNICGKFQNQGVDIIDKCYVMKVNDKLQEASAYGAMCEIV